jgi:hypothetical protein
MIATSHKRDNTAIASLFGSLGFVPWEIADPDDLDDEVYLMLSDAPST